MQKIVVDTDVIIDYTRNASLVFEKLLTQSSKNQIKLFVSASVIAELMSGQETHDLTKLNDLEYLLSKLELISPDYSLLKEAGFLLRDYRILKIGDAIVAATALFLNAKLATKNKKDFEGIKGLKFFKLS